MCKEWEHFSRGFHFLLPPARPSTQDVANYYSALRILPPDYQRILILGTTPELRIIAGEFSSDISVADFSLGMFNKTNEMVPPYIQRVEKRMLTNWLDLPRVFSPNSFDVIMGDLVIRQIPPFLTKDFLTVIRGLLREKGIFLTRTNVRNPAAIIWNPQEIILDGIKGLIRENKPTSVSIMTFRLYDTCTDERTFRVDHRRIRHAFREIDENSIAQDIRPAFYSLKKALSRKRATWTHYPQVMLDAFLRRSFTLKDHTQADDYPDTEFFPFYALTKRS